MKNTIFYIRLTPATRSHRRNGKSSKIKDCKTRLHALSVSTTIVHHVSISVPCLAKPIVQDVKKKISEEDGEAASKIVQLNARLKDIRQKSDRDLIGGRQKTYDWEAIAITNMEDKRSPIECQLRWSNTLHPDIRHKALSKSEIIELLGWVKKFGDSGKWRQVAEKMQGRTALQCFTEYRKQQLVKDKGRAWTPEEDQRLIEYGYRKNVFTLDTP